MLSMNKHDKLPEWIDRFNNKDLHGKELEEFLELMKQDPELRREVKLDEDLNKILTDNEIIELRKKLDKYRIPKESNRIGLPIIFLAASIVILIGLVALIFILMRHSDDATIKSDYTYKSDTSSLGKNQLSYEEQLAVDLAIFDSIKTRQEQARKEPDDEFLLTDNYKPYPPYESMVGEVNRAIDFKLITPSASDNIRKASVIGFSWETKSVYPLVITVTDNKGQSLFVSDPIQGRKFSYNTSKLNEGLYYVKFILNDEIVYFAKFTLK
jgi:hypothetical protein